MNELTSSRYAGWVVVLSAPGSVEVPRLGRWRRRRHWCGSGALASGARRCGVVTVLRTRFYLSTLQRSGEVCRFLERRGQRRSVGE